MAVQRQWYEIDSVQSILFISLQAILLALAIVFLIKRKKAFQINFALGSGFTLLGIAGIINALGYPLEILSCSVTDGDSCLIVILLSWSLAGLLGGLGIIAAIVGYIQFKKKLVNTKSLE